MGSQVNITETDVGHRLLPVIADLRALHEPDKPWCSLPFDDYDLSQGYEDISYAQLANAANKLAWLIKDNFGESTTFETFAYLGVPDVRYHIMELAACKTGYKVLFSSQLNSLAVHLSLMEQTECHKLLSAVGVHVGDMLAARPMQHVVIPDLDDLLDLSDKAPLYPYTKTWEEAAQDPYLVLHSSGTTGDPKPVVVNHAGLAAMEAHQLLPDVEGRAHCLEISKPGDGARFLMSTSPYHVLSSAVSMIVSIFNGSVFVPGYRHRGCDSKGIFDVLEYSKVTRGVLMPWMMEDVARHPNAKFYIEPFDMVWFGGAVLSPYAGKIWSQYTRVQNGFGSTETFAPAQLLADNEDYAYVHFDPVYGGVDMRKIDVDYTENGAQVPVHEMVFVCSEKLRELVPWHIMQGVTPTTAPPYPEYANGDLWTPHPDPKKASFAWRFVGRKDDLVTFSTGVNLHPGPMERAVGADRRVRSVLLTGNRRRQPVLLIELAGGEEPDEQTKTAIYDAVVRDANTKTPAHGQVPATHMLLVPTDSFVRTVKGSVMRKRTEARFAAEIDAIYDKHGDEWQEGKRIRYDLVEHGRKHVIRATVTPVKDIAN